MRALELNSSDWWANHVCALVDLPTTLDNTLVLVDVARFVISGDWCHLAAAGDESSRISNVGHVDLVWSKQGNQGARARLILHCLQITSLELVFSHATPLDQRCF